MEILLIVIVSLSMLLAVCLIGSFVLCKNTKNFHIHFSLFKGFDISGSFFDEEQD